MKVSLSKVFPLDGASDAAWRQLQDIEAVAGCMPGAEITEKTDESHYKGKVKVTLGPVKVAFSGSIEVKNIDAGERRLHLVAAGKDDKGTSSASMDLTARIDEGDSSACQLAGDAEVTVNGKLANFGGRMMTQVAEQILQQFADNFAARLRSANSAGGGATARSELNGLKFAWSVITGLIKRLFGRAA